MQIRTSKPVNNKFYITKSKGGYSACIQGYPTDASCNVLANCVGYACGRFNEIIGSMKYPSLNCNAENFIERAKNTYGLQVVSYPTLGGIMVWQKGATLSGNVALKQASSSTTAYTATANIVKVTVNSVTPTSIDLAPTDPSTDYPFTVTFATSNMKTLAIDLNNAPASTDGKFTITNWGTDGSNIVATGKFNGGGSYGGASRNNSTTVSLQSKAAGSSAVTCVVTANFPAMEFVSSSATDIFTTTTDATKTGTASFVYNYAAEDDFPSAATLTHTSGSGSFSITGKTVTTNTTTGETTVTITYSFNPNSAEGVTKEELTLTAADGTSQSVTLTGTAEAEATDDAKVIAADGTTLIYQGDWATALSKANTAANSGCTLQLLRDISGITSYQAITNTFTLDLNGKKLTGKCNGSLIYINKSGKTLTIKDSKTGGIIENINNAYEGIAYCVNVNAGLLVLQSGTLYVENKGASKKRAIGINQVAGMTVTINGGKVEAYGYNDSFGVYQASNKNNNTTFTMNGGEIYVEGYTNIYGILAYGKVNINDGVVNAVATYTNCRGIHMTASASATAASCYWGTLTMKGGTVNSHCTANADGTRYAYGLYFDCSNASMGTATATDGSHANKAAATGNISNAVINSQTEGRYSYGVYATGSYQSKSNSTSVLKFKETTINSTSQYYYTYGVWAHAGVNSTNGGVYTANIDLTDCEVNATTTKYHTAYAVWAATASGTVYKNVQPNYYGEYAGGAKITVNSGTYTATTGTTTAYAIGTNARSKTIYGSETNVSAERTVGGNAEGYATLIIHGGKFIANSGTTTARAVSNGGNCTIDGGEFYATAGTTTADGIYSLSGKLKASSVPIEVSSTSTAYGIRVDVSDIPVGNQAWTGFTYAGDVELNNVDVKVTTRTGASAYGVYVNAKQALYTQVNFDNQKTTSSWSDDTYTIYSRVFPGDSTSFAAAGKISITGGSLDVSAATTSAYGIYAVTTPRAAMRGAQASPEVTVKKATISAKTNGTTTACGIQAGGPLTVESCDITAEAKTTGSYGIYQADKKATVTKTIINASGTATVYGIWGNASLRSSDGNEWHAELELGKGNEFTATATSGNTSYAVWLVGAAPITVTGKYAGDYATQAVATISDGTYTATATGTTCYAIGMSARQVKNEAVSIPVCTVNGGKFWGKATGGTDGCVHGNGQMGYVVLNAGYYNVNTNLSKYVGEGKNINDVLSGTPEYTEGYRYTIGDGVTGAVVCRAYLNGSSEAGAFKTLQEGINFVNKNSGNTYTLVMVANYTLPKGNYTIPAKTTLIVPNSLTQKAAMGTKPTREAVSTPAPVQFLMLTFAKGVNMTVYGGIETTAKQNAANGGSAIAGAPHGNYGRIHLMEGSKVDLESGSNLNCWGYITGKGEIQAKSGSTVREGFQLGYWRGGTATSNMLDNKSTWHAFPVTDYFIQNIEAPILFRPGSTEYGYSAVNVSIIGIQQANDIKLVGTSGAMFLMETADASADTWVKKEYDPATDISIWTVNSGAKLGQFSFSLAGQTVNSADYYLPVSNNMTININEGEFTVTQDAMLIPGAVINISKLGKLTVSSGKRLFVMDNEDWPGFMNASATATSRWYYNATYSPSWTTNPRTAKYPPASKPLPDAEIFVHGTTEGQYYTTEHGANIHSTDEDAGVVRFIANAGAATSIQHIVNTNCSTKVITFTSAQLKNEIPETPYTPTTGTVAGDAYTYMDQMWVNTKENGCLLTRTDGSGTHELAHPSDMVAVLPNADNSYRSETGSRNFIFAEKSVTTAGCTWWEAEKVTSGTYAGDYMANQDRYDNYGAYYYYDASSGYWKPRYVTVTWKQVSGATLATYSNVMYNTSPKYTGVAPTVPASTSTYTCAWTGWDDPDGNFYDKNETLPVATGNITYKAHIDTTKYQYLITFKNDNNKVIYSYLVDAGAMPVCPPELLVKASTTTQDFTFSGWDKTIVAASEATEYVAQYTASPRKYTVTFVDYDNTFLADTLINYNDVAVYPTLAAEPYRESTEAFSYEWTGWTKTLAKVTKDVTYVAKYKQTTIKYTVIFRSLYEDDTEVIHKKTDYSYGATPALPTNPTRPKTDQYTYTFDHWDPAVVDVTGPATYTAVYTTTLRTYTIKWMNGSTTLETDTDVPYGTTPKYDGATPTKAATAQYTYTFSGWSPAISSVVGAQTYTAQFSSTVNKYTITFLDGDNNVFATQTLDYGATPTAPAGTPTKTSTAQYNYTFDAWPTFATVTGDKSYKATFTSSTRSHNITFVNYDGTQLQVVSLPYNTSAANVKAAYTAATPTKPSSVSEDYTFKGWTPTVAAVTGPATYTADYTASARKYTITFQNYDGTTLQSSDVAYGSTPTYSGSTPTRPDDATYSYTFDGWTPSIASVSGVQTYTATYSTAPSEFGNTVDIIDWTSSTVTVNANGYSSSTTGAKWKMIAGGNTYTQDSRQADRTLNISVSGLVADEKFFIETQDNTGAVESRHGYRVPYIFNGNTTLGAVAGDNKSVIFVRGGKLKVNANVQVDAIYVAPDAQLEIAEGVTLKANKLVLRCKPFSPAVLINNGTLTCSKVYYSFITTSNQQTYPFGLPIKSVVDNITFSNGKKATLGANFTMMYYDGASRAESGVTGNWKVLEDANVAANKGYNLLSASKYYCEYYFPITYAKPADGKTVAVTAYKGNLGDGENGWNYVVSPYTHIFTCNYASVEDQLKISTVSPDDYGVFDQYVPEVIYPNTPFFYQAAKSGSLSFAASAFTKKKPAGELVNENVPTQWLKLYFGSDQTGKRDQTNFYLHPDKFTEEYEIDYDLTKMSKEGSLPLIYTSIACGDLAFAALPDTLVATKNIPLTVFAPKADDMYFSLGNTNFMTRVESVLLYDNDLNNITDLMLDDYVCQLAEGTTSERFSLRVLFRKAEVATDIVSQEEQGGDLKVYVMGNTLQINLGNEHANIYCFDAVGKLIKYQPNASQSLNIEVPAAGVYFLQIGNKVEKVIVK